MLTPRVRNNNTAGGEHKSHNLPRKLFTVFPLLLFPIIVYILIVLTSGNIEDSARPAVLSSLDSAIVAVPMISGVGWELRVGDILLFFGLMMLSVEIVKSTSSRSGAIVNHVASMMIFIFCIITFVIFRSMATSTFFLLTMMSLLDVIVGVVVTIVSARRDFGVGDGFGG